MSTSTGHPVFRAPLTGRTVVEASAGTGKTWTIAGLYLRLICEAELEPRQILVVTFTKAATAELKTRIRRRLVAMDRQLAGRTSEDELIARIAADHPDRRALARRVRLAIETLDDSAIHTIHGFCQRVLAEHAFESEMPFEVELVEDERELLARIAADACRREAASASPLWARYLAEQSLGPRLLLDHARDALNTVRPVILVPDVTGGAAIERAFGDAYHAARAIWQAEPDRVRAVLRDGALDGRRYRADWIEGWLRQLDAYLAPRIPGLAAPERLDKFTNAALRSAARGRAPEHPLFDRIEELVDLLPRVGDHFATRWQAMLGDFARLAPEQLAAAHREASTQSFNDLLTRVETALTRERGERLAAALQERYRVALVDEFQDTDTLQYAILNRLFGRDGSGLVMVGDPKQAIYAFRGADVFAYLAARREAACTLTLSVNRRSSPALVKALNVLFGGTGTAFVLPEIGYVPAESQSASESALQLEDGHAPMELWHADANVADAAGNKNALREWIAAAVAAEIERLLECGGRGQARIVAGGSFRPLIGSDIAVLVPRHEEARSVREALARRGLACVTLGESSVYASEAAHAFEQVLGAVARPNDEALVRGALATLLFGRTAGEIAALATDLSDWERVLEEFRELHDLAARDGVLRLLQELLEREAIAGRILTQLDGERHLTDLRHVVELLAQAARRSRLDLSGLVRYLGSQRDTSLRHEEVQLRLESDRSLVRVLTVHAAKGLEYPIVFCPYLWDSVRKPDADRFGVRLHDPEAGGALTIDFGSPRRDRNLRIARVEEFAERVRLAYVAITRAKHRCYVVWCAARESSASAMGWLLHGPDAIDGHLAAALEAHRQRLDGLSAAAMQGELLARVAPAEGAIRVRPMPARDATAEAGPVPERRIGRAIEFRARIPAPRRVVSFSSLLGRVEADAPDHDQVTIWATSPAAGEEGAGLPRGARFGSFLHAVLERIDFASERHRTAIIERTEREFGFATTKTAAVAGLIENVLAAPLDRDGVLRLQDLPAARRRAEVEFAFALQSGSGRALVRALETHRNAAGLPALASGGIDLDLGEGYAKGYIDLVFEHAGRYFLADYKSNWLGPNAIDYAPEPLREVIAHELYDLQYLLYSIALDRWLAQRIPGYEFGRHFGGVYYLFVRGMRAVDGEGVYFARPDAEVMAALRAMVAPGGAVARARTA